MIGEREQANLMCERGDFSVIGERERPNPVVQTVGIFHLIYNALHIESGT